MRVGSVERVMPQLLQSPTGLENVHVTLNKQTKLHVTMNKWNLALKQKSHDI